MRSFLNLNPISYIFFICYLVYQMETTFANNLQTRTTARRIFLKQYGKNVFGMANECDPNNIPEWYDPEAFRRAQDLYYTYGGLMHYAHIYGLLLGYLTHNFVTPVLLTGHSGTVAKLFSRYLSTLYHVQNWFRFDPFDPKNKSFQSLKTVRGYHRKFGNEANRLTGRMMDGGDKQVWLGQWHINQGLYTFVGMYIGFPKVFGFNNFSKNDIHCLIHFWRVIGHCMGIEDTFNICSGEDGDVITLCQQIFYEEWLPEIRNSPDPVGKSLGQGLLIGMRRIFPMFNYNAMLRYISKDMKLRQDDYPLNGIVDKLQYAYFWILFKVFSRSVICMWILSRIASFVTFWAYYFENYNRHKLEIKYDGQVFESYDKSLPRVKLPYKTASQLKLC